MTQFLFAFIAGAITVASPCIIPILPIVLSSSLKKNKFYPVLMVLGMGTMFSLLGVLFGAFGSVLGISKHGLESAAVWILFLMGLMIASETISAHFAKLMNPVISKFSSGYSKKEDSAWEAFFLGIIMGVVWAPCAGPILASILALAASAQNISTGFFLLFTYSVGAGIPMLIIAYGGRRVLLRQRWVTSHSARIKKIFGWILMLTAVGLYFGLFRVVEAAVIPYLPDFISTF